MPRTCPTPRAAALALLLSLSAPLPALAEPGGAAFPAGAEPAGEDAARWRFSINPYIWISTNKTVVAFEDGSQTITVRPGDVLDNTEAALMVAAAAQKGHFGVFTDVYYGRIRVTNELGGQLTVNGLPLPIDVAALLDVVAKSRIMTFGANYRLLDRPRYQLSGFAGARQLWLRYDIDYAFTGNIGSLPIVDTGGSFSAVIASWDAIGGLSGTYALSADGRWFVPVTMTLGTGQSEFMWEAVAGIGRRFGFGDVRVAYRHLSYRLPDETERVAFFGPAIGATFRF